MRRYEKIIINFRRIFLFMCSAFICNEAYNEYLKLRNDLSHKENNNVEKKELLFKILENEKYILNSIVNLNGEIRNVINEYSRLSAQLSNNEIVVECCYIPVCNNLSDIQYYYGYG